MDDTARMNKTFLLFILSFVIVNISSISFSCFNLAYTMFLIMVITSGLYCGPLTTKMSDVSGPVP